VAKVADPYIVGLTGGIGSGKTTVANLFAARGAALVDTDVIAHELTAAGGAAMPLLAGAFGASIVDAAGALDRGEMRRRVFADPALRRQLEAILHPLIRAESLRRCAAASVPYVLLIVPLLIESGAFAPALRRILVIDCPEAVQVARVMARNGLAAEEVRAIMAAQVSRAERLAAADDVIVNAGDLADIERQVAALDADYRRRALEVKASC
jgi:dephospho-CoA kinase